ncbi:MAG: cation-translocating P-type ATPase [Bacteriovorax sp.]|nr:cation-translocating P-type ATPase [Bacteriovorax sp.]
MSLTNEQALDIRKKSGWNEIIPTQVDSRLVEIKHALSDPMGVMLLGLGIIYLIVGQTSDAIVLFLSFIPVTAVDIMLQLKAKRALSALKATLNPLVKLFRNGEIVEVPIREIVPGDTIIFEEGQSLAADGKILECEHLQINESALTGESIPITKTTGHLFYAGTTILQGRGLGLVERTAKETKFGKIATLLETTEDESSPLKKKVDLIVKRLFLIALGMSLILFFLIFFLYHSWSNALIESLTFGMSAIPEEFPLVFTLYLSMGAYRLSKHGVLVKSLPSVEALGSVDVICTDKTGTLTEGKFQLETLVALNQNVTNEGLWQSALMACEIIPVDAMEVAIAEKAALQFVQLKNWTLTWDYPFESKGKHMSHVWRHQSSNQCVVAMKGSVEGVLEHCKLELNENIKITEQVQFWASKGKRLLALAHRSGPCTGKREIDELDLTFIGLFIFSDPVRSSAKEAILKCQESGITVKMLTGDHPLTAHAIADELGLIHSHDYLFTGEELAQMNKEDRDSSYQKGAIFSRVLPEQKHEMVQALKKSGKVVAMTGDGINDAPALKTADIGISMGKNATDVARSSAKMILMKNDFQGIIEAVFEGRKIFSNLKRSFSYLISFHIPIIFFALIPPLLGLGSLLLPIHIVLLQLIVHPVSAFSFENLPAKMATKERALINTRSFLESFLSGILLSIGGLMLYQYVLKGNDNITARSVTLATIMLGNLFFIFVESWPKITIRFILTISCLILFMIMMLTIPLLSRVFYITNFSFKYLFIGLGIAFLSSLPTFLLRQKSR